MAAVDIANERRSSPEWARKYPPLLALALAMIMVIAILPSSLNLPQANPTQTLEYAPVPPDDESQDNSGTSSELWSVQRISRTCFWLRARI